MNINSIDLDIFTYKYLLDELYKNSQTRSNWPWGRLVRFNKNIKIILINLNLKKPKL